MLDGVVKGFSDVVFDELADLGVFLKEVAPGLLAKHEAMNVCGALEHEQGLYILSTVVRTNQSALVNPQHILGFSSDFETDIYAAGLNEDYLLYLLQFPVKDRILLLNPRL